MTQDSEFLKHVPCDTCGSSDANSLFTDGHQYCFSCLTYVPGDGEPVESTSKKKDFKPIVCENFETTVRGIKPTTFQHWKYKRGEFNGDSVHVANFYHDGQLVGQKIRTKDKEFKVLGSLPQLYGMWLWKNNGRKVVVTEGELDALSVSSIQGDKWPVVSLTNGASSAVKAFQQHVDWLCGFDEVVICFDNDEPGREAALKAAAVLPPGKAFIVQLPGDYKDANEMLKAKDTQKLSKAIWDANQYRPDGIVTLDDVYEKVLTPVEMGYSWPWPKLTAITYGRRLNESYYVGAGTGIGKTTFVMEIIHHDAQVLNLKTGVIPLEQTPQKFFQRYAGAIGNRKFHKPSDGSWSQEDLSSALGSINKENLYVYDSKGSSDWDDIKGIIRYLAVGCGCTSIYLDNLTGLRGERNESNMEFLDRVTRDIASLVLELPIMLTVVSHLATPEKGSHEEGARVKLREFKGSRSIGAWAHNAIGLERNQQHAELKDITTVRILKDREMGEAAGLTIQLKYDHSIGRMIEYNGDEEDHFEDEEGDFY